MEELASIKILGLINRDYYLLVGLISQKKPQKLSKKIKIVEKWLTVALEMKMTRGAPLNTVWRHFFEFYRYNYRIFCISLIEKVAGYKLKL